MHRGSLAVVVLAWALAPLPLAAQTCTPKLLGANRRGPATEVVPAGELAYLVEGARLIVLDVSDPATPVALGRTELSARPVDLQGSGTVLASAAGYDGFFLVDAADPSHPVQRALLRLPGYTADVALGPGLAFVAGAPIDSNPPPDVRVYDLADLAHPVQIGTWSDFVDADGAGSLALVGPNLFVGTTGQLHVLDVSDPASPQAVASIWFHDYPGELVPSPDGRRLYYRAGDGHEEGNSIGIVDIADPLQPVRLWSEYSDDGWGGVAGEGDRLYATDSRDGLVVFDLADPSAPVRLAEAPMLRGANDLAAAGSRLFAAIGDDGLRVADVGDPLAPRIVGAYDARSPAIGLAVAGRFVYLRGSGELRILDLADPRSPFERSQVATFDGGYFGSDQLAHRDGKVFLPDAGGLRVIDVAHPAQPVEIGAYATDRPAKAVAVRGPVVFVALAVPREADPDLLALDVSDPAHPQRIGGLDLSLWDVSRLAASGDLLLAGSYYGCRVLDVSTPAQPVEIGDCSPGHTVDDVVLQGARAFLVGSDRFDILGLGDPAAPRLLGSLAFDGQASGIAVRGEHAGIVGGWGYAHGFQIVDVSVPALPVTLGRTRTPGYSRRVRAGPLGFYVADGDSGLSVFRDCPFFADGFESGDTSRWSVVEGG